MRILTIDHEFRYLSLDREERKRIVIEVPRRIPDPSEYLWNLSEHPHDIDAIKLVEDSWEKE